MPCFSTLVGTSLVEVGSGNVETRPVLDVSVPATVVDAPEGPERVLGEAVDEVLTMVDVVGITGPLVVDAAIVDGVVSPWATACVAGRMAMTRGKVNRQTRTQIHT